MPPYDPYTSFAELEELAKRREREEYDGALPSLNQFDQFQVGGRLGGNLGILDMAYDIMPWRAAKRTGQRMQDITSRAVGVAGDTGVWDWRMTPGEVGETALDSLDMLAGLAFDAPQLATLGYRHAVKPGARGVRRVLDEWADMSTASPWKSQGGRADVSSPDIPSTRPVVPPNYPPTPEAWQDALTMKAEGMFAPGGIDYDQIARETGVRLGYPEEAVGAGRMRGPVGLDRQLGAIGYHGSPHKFDRFDHSKMGTGEGAQAYGWGTYIAEDPKVAKHYKPLTHTESKAQYRKRLEAMSDDDLRGEVESVLGIDAADITEDDIDDWVIGDLLDADVQATASRGFTSPDDASHFYEVDIPDEKIAQMLDWDAPLSEQPEMVDVFKQAFERRLVSGDRVQRGQAEYALNQMMGAPGVTGRTMYHQLAGSDPQQASELLNQLGVPGIKYFDGNSRAAGKGTRNFVVFDENDLTIKSRNGEPVPEVMRGDAANTIGGKQRGAVGFKSEDLEKTPDVPQMDLMRHQAPKGKPGTLKGLLGPATGRRMADYAKRGEDAGGKGWYNLDPLREQFIAELGPVEGDAQFRRYADFLAATSPREKVKQNVKRASLFQNYERQGVPFAHLLNPGKAGGDPTKEIPQGYGSLGHETQRHLLKDLEGGGHFSGVTRPKVTSFAENLAGNQRPVTIDTHNMAALTRGKQKRSPTPGEYQYIEQFEQDIADQLGMTPAQFQASVWVGAGDETGVADVRPFLDVFNDVVVETAEKRGQTPAEALRDFITGKSPLLGLSGILAGGTLQMEEANGDREAATR